LLIGSCTLFFVLSFICFAPQRGHSPEANGIKFTALPLLSKNGVVPRTVGSGKVWGVGFTHKFTSKNSKDLGAVLCGLSQQKRLTPFGFTHHFDRRKICNKHLCPSKLAQPTLFAREIIIYTCF